MQIGALAQDGFDDWCRWALSKPTILILQKARVVFDQARLGKMTLSLCGAECGVSEIFLQDY